VSPTSTYERTSKSNSTERPTTTSRPTATAGPTATATTGKSEVDISKYVLGPYNSRTDQM